jgi:large subunit ribosomal protein L25
VDFVTRDLEIECLPGEIPEHIDVDVSELMLHQGVRVRDLQTTGKWTAVTEPDTMIVHVVALKAEEPAPTEAAAAAPAAASAEPEVIKKGKKEEEA